LESKLEQCLTLLRAKHDIYKQNAVASTQKISKQAESQTKSDRMQTRSIAKNTIDGPTSIGVEVLKPVSHTATQSNYPQVFKEKPNIPMANKKHDITYRQQYNQMSESEDVFINNTDSTEADDINQGFQLVKRKNKKSKIILGSTKQALCCTK